MRSTQQELGILGTISAFAYRHRETKKTLCRGGRSQDLPDSDFQPAIRQQKYVRQQYVHTQLTPFLQLLLFLGPVITNFAFKCLLVPGRPPKLVMPQVSKTEWDRRAVSHLQSLLFPREQNTSLLSIFQLVRCRRTEGQPYWRWDMSRPGSKAIS